MILTSQILHEWNLVSHIKLHPCISGIGLPSFSHSFLPSVSLSPALSLSFSSIGNMANECRGETNIALEEGASNMEQGLFHDDCGKCAFCDE